MDQFLIRPRLLPVTIFAMALLLIVKSVGLVRAASPAQAAGDGAPAAATTAPPVPAKPAAGPVGVAAPAPGQDVPAAVASGAANSGPAPEVPISANERALLQDLRRRSAALDERETKLSSREEIAAAAEKRLTARLDQLTALQKRLEELEAARRDRDEASWHGLVRVYEAMKPRDAAVIFNDLDMPVLLQVVDRMKNSKAAPVLAAMLPDRARQLTEELSQLRTRANAVTDATPPPVPAAPPNH